MFLEHQLYIKDRDPAFDLVVDSLTKLTVRVRIRHDVMQGLWCSGAKLGSFYDFIACLDHSGDLESQPLMDSEGMEVIHTHDSYIS